MSINLVEKVQESLHYPPLQKIDPNTQEVVVDETTPDEHKFSQAAIPAILTGLHDYSSTDEGAEDILRGDNSTSWVSKIFDTNKNAAIQKIAAYAYQSRESPVEKLNEIADVAVRLIRQEVTAGGTMMKVKDLLSSQMKIVLLYLPQKLHMGELMNDDTLDDNTHKMEGPISSLMHKIGSAFSNPASEEEVNKTGKI